ncbi:30S ribosomal protein S6 [Chloroflexota bacterium]
MVLDKVSAEKDEQLRDYELVIVISPAVDEEQLETAVNNVGQFVAGKGGVVSEVERWGKKKLAYPIRHFAEGNYVLTKFKMKPAFGKELEESLRISEEVLRHLLIRLDI